MSWSRSNELVNGVYKPAILYIYIYILYIYAHYIPISITVDLNIHQLSMGIHYT